MSVELLMCALLLLRILYVKQLLLHCWCFGDKLLLIRSVTDVEILLCDLWDFMQKLCNEIICL